MNRTTITSFVLLIVAFYAHCAVINIPDDFETIQGGIDATEEGDTVLVAPGVYVENIVFDHKSITVASFTLVTNNPAYIDSTIIDGDERDCVVAFINYDAHDVYYELPKPVLRGFTIRNGRQNWGGGIDCQGYSRPVLQDLLITENTAVCSGGGVYATYFAAPLIERSIIEFNDAEGDINSGFGGGGCLVRGPVNDYPEFDPFKLRDVIIRNNHSNVFGSGIMACDDGCFNLDRVILYNNFSESYSACVYLMESYGNYFNNVTIVGNDFGMTMSEDGGIDSDGSTLFLTNSIVWGNSDGQIFFWSIEEPDCTLTISYCAIQNGRNGVILERDARLNWLDGNIDEDPLFFDPDSGNFHLTEDSPCINAGDPESPPDPDSTRADMGAFPFRQRDIFVVPDTLVFGEMAKAADTLDFIIRNLGHGDLEIITYWIEPWGSSFRVVSDDDENFVIEPESEHIMSIEFAPPERGDYRAVLNIISDDPDEETVAVPLIGTALDVTDPFNPHPSSLILHPSFPNPFNSTTTIRYDLPQPSHVNLSIFDLTGRLVETLVDGRLEQGRYAETWQAEGLPSGLYFVKLEAGEDVRTRKVVLIR